MLLRYKNTEVSQQARQRFMQEANYSVLILI
jgi:hypothetical protein